MEWPVTRRATIHNTCKYTKCDASVPWRSEEHPRLRRRALGRRLRGSHQRATTKLAKRAVHYQAPAQGTHDLKPPAKGRAAANRPTSTLLRVTSSRRRGTGTCAPSNRPMLDGSAVDGTRMPRPGDFCCERFNTIVDTSRYSMKICCDCTCHASAFTTRFTHIAAHIEILYCTQCRCAAHCPACARDVGSRGIMQGIIWTSLAPHLRDLPVPRY